MCDLGELDHPRLALRRSTPDAVTGPCGGALWVGERLTLWGTDPRDVTYAVHHAQTGALLGGVHAGPARRAGATTEAWFWIRADDPDRPGLEAELECVLRTAAHAGAPDGAVRWLGLDCDWDEWAAMA